MKRISFVLAIMLMILPVFFISCRKDKKGNEEKVQIVIYTPAEETQFQLYQKRLAEKFPSYDIRMEWMSSGDGAARLKAEKDKIAADILVTWEGGYLGMLEENLASIPWLDNDIYLDDITWENKKFAPELRNSGAIVLNNKLIKEKGLPIPETYEDLLNPVYKNLIAMPNPKSSGTGYMFLKNLVNAWGEDKAFEYFDKLSDNILQYTTSGVGGLNALCQNEVAIGLGMTSHAVKLINEDGFDFTIKYFAEGAPYSIYGYAIVKGRENKKGVKEVFEYLRLDLTDEFDSKYYPEQIFKDKVYNIKGYPHPIPYGNMENNTPEEKARLLKKWKY